MLVRLVLGTLHKYATGVLEVSLRTLVGIESDVRYKYFRFFPKYAVCLRDSVTVFPDGQQSVGMKQSGLKCNRRINNLVAFSFSVRGKAIEAL